MGILFVFAIPIIWAIMIIGIAIFSKALNILFQVAKGDKNVISNFDCRERELSWGSFVAFLEDCFFSDNYNSSNYPDNRSPSNYPDNRSSSNYPDNRSSSNYPDNRSPSNYPDNRNFAPYRYPNRIDIDLRDLNLEEFDD